MVQIVFCWGLAQTLSFKELLRKGAGVHQSWAAITLGTAALRCSLLGPLNAMLFPLEHKPNHHSGSILLSLVAAVGRFMMSPPIDPSSCHRVKVSTKIVLETVLRNSEFDTE